jgi:exosome complex exonuclease RRP6
MLHYARTDTHHLLFIYDRLKQLLLTRSHSVPASLDVPLPPGVPHNPLGTVLERSRRICLTLYEKEMFTEASAGELLQR